MTYYIGIGKEYNSPGNIISILLFNRMLNIAPYTIKHWYPRFYYYNKESFTYCIKQEIISFKWFIGITIII